MGKFFKALMAMMLMVTFMPLTAGAIGATGVPMLDCHLEYQEFTAPGLLGDATDEDIYLYCKNKGDNTIGDATAYTVTITVVSPSFTTTNYVAAFGNLGLDGSFRNKIDLAVDETVKPGSKFDVEVMVDYQDLMGTAMEQVVETATIKVRKMPEVTVIGGHNSSALFIPGGKVLYNRSSDDTLAIWDPKTGNEVALLLTGGTYTCNSHPALSPNGKMIAFQRYNSVTTNAEIWVMNLNGTGLSQVAADASFCWGWPMWADNKSLVIRADDSAPEYASWWTVNIDGTELLQLTYEGFTYTPHGEVAMVGGIPMGVFQLNNDYIDVPKLQVYNIKTRVQLMTVPSILESGMGSFRPGSASLVYKDDWPDTGDLWTVNFKGKKKPLTLHKMDREFQVSSDATTIHLDQDDILEVLGVWRADDPKGMKYATVPFTFQQNDDAIILSEPLSGSTPGIRTGVLVSYLYAEGDENCYAKPHWSDGGGYMVYQYDFGSIQDAWAMDADGNNKIRLTFDDEMTSSDGRSLPIVSKDGNALLISNNGSLEYVKLGFNLADTVGTSSSNNNDDTTCGAVPGPIPGWWVMLSLLAPIAAGFGLRRFARR